MVKPQSRTIVVSDVTPDIFTNVDPEHEKTLSCPCTTIFVPQKRFVSNQVQHHPVCQSIFVSQQWIEALYLENASRYRPSDFRTIAYSQVIENVLFFTKSFLCVRNNPNKSFIFD